MRNLRFMLFGFTRTVSISLVLILVGFTAGPARSGPTDLGLPGVGGGVVTATETLAAQAGAEMLRKGGNAIDAAAAVQFALNVVEPQSSGIGGGGFMMVYLARERKVVVLDSRETAPAAATPDMFVSQSSFGTRSTSGYAVGVPGTPLGVATALKKWGTMSLAETLAPAIDLAENGFRVSSRLAEAVLSDRLANEPGDPAYEEARNVFVPGGTPLQAGDLLVQPDLAKTFKLMANQGVSAFYTGDIARAIVETQRNTRSTNDPDGVGGMELADLLHYKVAFREPVEDDYRGFRIVGMPPPSSGGLTSIGILKLVERFPIGDASQGFGFGSTRTINVMIEAMRIAFADRAVWIGDEDFVDVPGDGLLNDAYSALRSAMIDPDSRQIDVMADDPRPYDMPPHPRRHVRAANLPDVEGVNTTHFSIVDRFGNIVTYTSTIESSWGTGLMVPGYGFLLNNELTDFNGTPAFNPDPAAFNPGANDVAPGKRPRSSMAPTMVFHNNRPLAALGSPGGSTIIDTVLLVLSNLIDHEMPIQEAIDAPRYAQTSANGTTGLEQGFDDDVLDQLRDLGHVFRDPSFPGIVGDAQGSVQAVLRDRIGLFYGAADKRRIGAVISVRCSEIDDGRGHGSNRYLDTSRCRAR